MKPAGKKMHLLQRGSALALVLSVITILLAVGTGLLSLGLHSQLFSIRTGNEIVARSAADAGLTEALFRMNEQLKTKPWSDSSLPGVTDGALPGCKAIFSYNVTGDTTDGYGIECIGDAGRAQKKAEAHLRLQGPFDAALLVSQTIVMKPGSIVDGYNFSNPGEKLVMGTLTTLPNQITLGLNASVDGDVAVICAPGASITGETYAMAEEPYWPRVTAPQWLDGLGSSGSISDATTITNSGKYDSINVGKGLIITIDGPVSLYVVGNISLSNSAQIQISDSNPDAFLTLFMGGNLYSKNGGAINNLTKDSTRLKIFGLDGCTNLSFGATGTFYGAICAPNAMVNLKSSVEIYGSVLAASFNQGSSANFHYDAALRNVSVNDDLVRFVLDRWGED